MKARLVWLAAFAIGCSNSNDSKVVGGMGGSAGNVGGGGNAAGGGSGGGGNGGGGGGGNPDNADMGSSGTGLAAIHAVWTILLENHDYNEIVDAPNTPPSASKAPYINGLIQQYGLATNYKDSGTHPSLPNYLYLVSGATQYPGIIDLNPTDSFIIGSFPVKKDNLGNQLQTAGISWRSYQESMVMPCLKTPTQDGLYAPKHDPFLYFDDIQNGMNMLCAATNVDYGLNFATDLAAGTYKYMWITPNLKNDGHDPSATPADIANALKQSDTWCSTEIPKIMASASYQDGGVIFLTWDEAEGRNGDSKDQIPMIIISPQIVKAGFTSANAYDHASYLATVEDIFHLPRLGAAVNAQNMAEFFK